MRSVVVTGCSTGIGYGTARVLLGHGVRVFGSVRSAGDADRLTADFGPQFVPLVFDVTDQAAVGTAAERVREALGGTTLFGLVNNAGAAFPGPLLHLPIDDLRRQLEINLVGQVIVTQAFARLLGAEPGRAGGPGRIVMMSSVGGRRAMPFLGAYSASKFGLEGISESLRRELMVFGIDVIVIAPGAVATPIWYKQEGADLRRLANTVYGPGLLALREFSETSARTGLPPERIGEAVWKALTARRPRTRYTVTPDPARQFLMQWLPKRMIDRAIARRLGFTSRVADAAARRP